MSATLRPPTLSVRSGAVPAVPPFATDMHTPAFPRVTLDMATSASMIGLTLTAFFLGFAAGQLGGGPMVAPVAGALVITAGTWREVLWVLAGLGGLMLLMASQAFVFGNAGALAAMNVTHGLAGHRTVGGTWLAGVSINCPWRGLRERTSLALSVSTFERTVSA